jgi:hypothetical protein
MQPIDDLANHIRESYELVRAFERMLQVSDDPTEKLDLGRKIKEQWNEIGNLLKDYFGMCRRLNTPASNDIRQMLARFQQLLADDLQQAYSTLRHTVPQEVEALDQFVGILQEFGHFHENLNEWKDLHNLAQLCTVVLRPWMDDLAQATEHPENWTRERSKRMWAGYRRPLRRLEAFARNIRYTGEPFRRDGETVYGPLWMQKIAASQDELEIRLDDASLEMIYDSTLKLWDDYLDALDLADEQLREIAGELCALSTKVLKSLEKESHNG